MKKEITLCLCDDNPTFTEQIRNEILKCIANTRKTEMREFTSGSDLLEYCEKNPSDAVFLDIDMPQMNGFETAKRLREIKSDVIIVFVTSHEDMVFQSWEFEPFWFVRKRFLSDLEVVLPKLFEKIDWKNEKSHIRFLAGSKELIFETQKIVLLESSGHDVFIYDADGKREKYRCRISDAEQQLVPYNFVRIQNGILVNLRFVSKVTSREVILLDGKKYPLGRNRIDNVRNEFQKFMRKM